jgi:hypothetical protein
LAVAVIVFPIVSGAVQMRLDANRANEDRKLEALKFEKSIELERAKNDNAIKATNYRNTLEVRRLFLDKYEGAKADKQLRTVQILLTLYPDEFIGVAKLFQTNAASPRVKTKVQKAEESARQLAQQPTAAESSSKAPTAASEELLGFRSIIKGELVPARNHFNKAYSIFPNYHNVDEISHQVLNDALIERYKTADPAEAQDIRRKVASQIVKDYSWGVPRSELAALRKLAQ